MRKCLHCNKEIPPKKDKRQRFCNKKCFYLSRKKNKPIFSCLICHKHFKSNKFYKGRKPPLFCSSKCYGKYRQIKYSGKNHNSWKGGVVYRNNYRYLYVPNHPHCTNHGYVAEHRLKMENKLGRFLDTKKEVVHHIDGNTKNNIISNLQLLTRASHLLLHHFPDKYDILGH